MDSYTKMLLHFDGDDGSTIFLDDIGNIWTAQGNAQTDTAQYKFGTASLLLDADGDYITTPDSEDFNFGGEDFTIDCWVRLNQQRGTAFLICQRTGYQNNHSFQLWFSYGKLFFGYTTNGSNLTIQEFNTTLSINTWYHVAIVRNGTTLKCYINGVAESNTVNMSTNSIYNSSAVITVGGISDANQSLDGWIDEFRVSKGIARWTSNFTPPTAGEYPTLIKPSLMGIKDGTQIGLHWKT